MHASNTPLVGDSERRQIRRNPLRSWKPLPTYIGNIRGFDEFKGDKLLCYGDLVVDSKPAVRKVRRFAGTTRKDRGLYQRYHRANACIGDLFIATNIF